MSDSNKKVVFIGGIDSDMMEKLIGIEKFLIIFMKIG